MLRSQKGSSLVELCLAFALTSVLAWQGVPLLYAFIAKPLLEHALYEALICHTHSSAIVCKEQTRAKLQSLLPFGRVAYLHTQKINSLGRSSLRLQGHLKYKIGSLELNLERSLRYPFAY